MSWLERNRMPIIALLVAVIAVGGAVLVYRLNTSPHSSEIVITPSSPQITVHVDGEVVNPGVYVLDGDDRIEDAIDAAGGFTRDAYEVAVNLAAPLRDGSRIHVYSLGDVPQKININTAESWLLEALPGIGEVLARRIIDYRSENGPFIEVEDLKMVEGIGTATFDRLKDRITVH